MRQYSRKTILSVLQFLIRVAGTQRMDVYTLRYLLLRMGYVRLAMDNRVWPMDAPFFRALLCNFRYTNLYEGLFQREDYYIGDVLSVLRIVRPDTSHTHWKTIQQQILADMQELERVKPRLKEAGIEWFALNHWMFNWEKMRIAFALNPKNQQRYRPGEYTIYELKQAIRGQGPVMKNGVAR